MSKFFVNICDIYSDVIYVRGEAVNHIKNVLRLKCGDHTVLSDGAGNDYSVRITAFDADCVRTEIIDYKKNDTESSVEVVLFQGIAKGDKMDFIIQKSVELGVCKIIPIFTERTIVKITNSQDVRKKTDRWNRISEEASKQSNRGIIPTVAEPMDFFDALNYIKDMDLVLIPYEKECKSSPKNYLRNYGENVSTRKIAVFIGPEGGFTEREISASVEAGAKPVTLGPRILRTETAGLATLAMIIYESEL